MKQRKNPWPTQPWEKLVEWLALALGCAMLWLGSPETFAAGSSAKWTRFVPVAGQPEPVPAQWVATPEGQFAHSIRIPNPVPKDSGYRWWMTSEQYFNHLCKTEAGEFIFKTVENVEGFYFMRPPNRPTDDDLMDRYKLEDPYTERYYQLVPDRLPDRPAQFVDPPFRKYKYVEEPRRRIAWQPMSGPQILKFSGYRFDTKEWRVVSAMLMESVQAPVSAHGITWRGLKRAMDREHAIAGSELIALDVKTQEVLGVLRNFAMSPRARNTPDEIWWLNASSCPQFPSTYRNNLGQQMYQFVSKVLIPNNQAH
jgi:hypothetical protein